MIIMTLKYAYFFAAGVATVIISDKLADRYYEKKYKANFMRRNK